MYDDTPIRRVRDDGPCRFAVVHSARARYNLVNFENLLSTACNRVFCTPAVLPTSEPTLKFIKLKRFTENGVYGDQEQADAT